MDARAVCMKNGRIYAFSFGNYLTCLNADNRQPGVSALARRLTAIV